MICRLVLGCALVLWAVPAAATDRAAIDGLVSQHAKANGVPEALVHRIIARESGYDPRAARGGNFGLMQIRFETARGMGYTGSASGLLDANTNLTYAVPYLANAYKVAGGDHARAVTLYAGGYYYVAKRKGLLKELRTGASAPVSAEAVWSSPIPVHAAVFTPAGSR